MPHTMPKVSRTTFLNTFTECNECFQFKLQASCRLPIQSEFSSIPLEYLEETTQDERVKILRTPVWPLMVTDTDQVSGTAFNTGLSFHMKGNNQVVPRTATKIQSNWNSMNSTEKSRNEGNAVDTRHLHHHHQWC